MAKQLLPYLRYELEFIAEWERGVEASLAINVLRDEHAKVAKRWSKAAWKALDVECSALIINNDGEVQFDTLAGICVLINKAVDKKLSVATAKAACGYLLKKKHDVDVTPKSQVPVNKHRQKARDSTKTTKASKDYGLLRKKLADDVLSLQQEEAFEADPRNFLPALRTMLDGSIALEKAMRVAADQIQEALDMSKKPVERSQKTTLKLLRDGAGKVNKGQTIGKIAPMMFTAGGKPKTRRSPRVDANEVENRGQVMMGADRKWWVSLPDTHGVYRWKKLNGSSIV